MKAGIFFGAFAVAAALLCACDKNAETGDYGTITSIMLDRTAENHYMLGVQSSSYTGQIHLVVPEVQDYTGGAVDWQSDGYPYQPKAGDYTVSGSMGQGGSSDQAAAYGHLFSAGSGQGTGYALSSGKISFSYPSAGNISVVIDVKGSAMDGSGEKDLKLKYEGAFQVNASYQGTLKSIMRLEDDGSKHQYSIQMGIGTYTLQFLVKSGNGEYYVPSAGQPDLPYGSAYSTMKGNLQVQRAVRGSENVEIDSATLETYLQNGNSVFVVNGTFVPRGGAVIQFSSESKSW